MHTVSDCCYQVLSPHRRLQQHEWQPPLCGGRNELREEHVQGNLAMAVSQRAVQPLVKSDMYNRIFSRWERLPRTKTSLALLPIRKIYLSVPLPVLNHSALLYI